MPQKPRNKVTVILADDEFERLDRYCRERAYKKSTLIARLVRQYLDLEGFGVAREAALNRFARGSGK